MSAFYRCDRCGKEMRTMPDLEEGAYVIGVFNEEYRDREELDLCRDCQKELREWVGKCR